MTFKTSKTRNKYKGIFHHFETIKCCKYIHIVKESAPARAVGRETCTVSKGPARLAGPPDSPAQGVPDLRGQHLGRRGHSSPHPYTASVSDPRAQTAGDQPSRPVQCSRGPRASAWVPARCLEHAATGAGCRPSCGLRLR